MHKKNESAKSEELSRNQIMSNILFGGMAILIGVVAIILRSRHKLTSANIKLQAAYQKVEEGQQEVMRQNLELKFQQEEIKALNNNLETIVKEITTKLIQRSNQLHAYAFFNAHKMRSPITTILGLHEILNLSHTETEKNEIFCKIKEGVVLLEKISRISQKMLEENRENE